jgi:hypothetical protein
MCAVAPSAPLPRLSALGEIHPWGRSEKHLSSDNRTGYALARTHRESVFAGGNLLYICSWIVTGIAHAKGVHLPPSCYY